MNHSVSRAVRWLSPTLKLTALLGISSALSAQDVGYVGPGLAGCGASTGALTVTESKPQNKVWFADNRWWAGLWNSTALEFRIHKLDPVTHGWFDTGVAIENRKDSHFDALAFGTKLYIVSHEYSTGPGSPGDPILLLRYTYAGGTYALDAGFPLTIGDSATESAMIERDGTGRLWAVWKQSLRVYHTYTLGSETLWATPAPLPGSTTDFDPDDICAIQKFGNRVGVMWNDNVQADFLFQYHNDADAPTTWSPVEVVWDGQSDDHINLAAGTGGRVFATIKNDNEDVVLAVRSTAGVWNRFPIIDGDIPSERLSRPIVLLNETDQTVQVFASFGGAIYKKSSPMGTISFAPGLGTLVMRDADGLLNNPTSTRQNITPQTGLVVLAANLSQAGNYWSHQVAGVSPGLTLNPPTPGTAGVQNTFVVNGVVPNAVVSFLASPTTGTKLITRPTCPSGIPTGLGNTVVVLGNAKANASGTATLNISVSAGLAGKTYYLQVVEAAQCRASNRVTEVF